MKLGAGEFLLVLILGVGSGRGDCDCRHLSELSDQVSELRSTLQIHAEWFRQQRSREEETIGRSTGAARRQNILLEQMKLLLANLNADVTRLRQSRLPQLEMRMSSIETEVVKRQEAGNPADETPGRSGRQSAALREMQESIDDLKDQTFMAKETLNVFGDIILARNRNDSAEAYQNLTARMLSAEETMNRLAEEVAIVRDLRLQRLESMLKRMESQHQQQQQQQEGFSRLDRFIFEQMKVLLANLNDKMTTLLQKRLPQLESAARITTYL